MVKPRIARKRLRSGAGVALLAGALLTPSHAAAFPLRDMSPRPGLQMPCPPGSERGDDFPLPTRAGVRELIHDFVGAYNDGDLARLNGQFADEEAFQWYFVQGEREQDAARRETLLPYFAQRHALEDRLRLVEVTLGREPGWHGGYDFAVRLKRRSSEGRARGWWHGKGAADCAIFTWGLGKE